MIGLKRSSAIAACWWKRSEEHTSELQSQSNLVCRLLLEKKKKMVRADEQEIHELLLRVRRARRNQVDRASVLFQVRRAHLITPEICHPCEHPRCVSRLGS